MKLQEYEQKIADLPDTEEGNMRKKLMEKFKETLIAGPSSENRIIATVITS